MTSRTAWTALETTLWSSCHLTFQPGKPQKSCLKGLFETREWFWNQTIDKTVATQHVAHGLLPKSGFSAEWCSSPCGTIVHDSSRRPAEAADSRNSSLQSREGGHPTICSRQFQSELQGPIRWFNGNPTPGVLFAPFPYRGWQNRE